MKPGVTAIPFEFNILTGAAGEFYAATFVYSAGRKRARLLFDCDEAAVVYVNNRQALRQGYDEAFVHWLGEEEHDDFPGTGIHRGQGRRVRPAEVDLEGGGTRWAWCCTVRSRRGGSRWRSRIRGRAGR